MKLLRFSPIPFVIFSTLLLSVGTYAQTVSGFYVVVKTKKNCANTLRSHDGTRSYCLPQEPVITDAEFESVGDINYDSASKLKQFTLQLTVQGFKQLKFLTQKLPESQLALVIENEVAGIFDDVDKYVSRIIAIKGGINTPEVESIHDKLKKRHKR